MYLGREHKKGSDATISYGYRQINIGQLPSWVGKLLSWIEKPYIYMNDKGTIIIQTVYG